MAALPPKTAPVEEEDEFEEFAEEDWKITTNEDASLWDDKWDTDEVDEAFAKKLQATLDAMTAAAAAAPAQDE